MGLCFPVSSKTGLDLRMGCRRLAAERAGWSCGTPTSTSPSWACWSLQPLTAVRPQLRAGLQGVGLGANERWVAFRAYTGLLEPVAASDCEAGG